MNLKLRRWWLVAIVAIVVVVGVVGIILLREQPKELGRVVVAGQSEGLAGPVVALRFDAPTSNPVWMGKCRSRDAGGHMLHDPPEGTFPYQLVQTGDSVEFSLPAPHNGRWFVEVEVWDESKGLDNLLQKARYSLKAKSLRHWTALTPWHSLGWVKSELNTNAVPSTADAPRP